MLKLQVETVTSEVERVIDIVCNVCGESCKDRCDMNYEGLIEAAVECGYGSAHFGDTTSLRFSICEKCLFEMVKNWKLSPIVAEDSQSPEDL